MKRFIQLYKKIYLHKNRFCGRNPAELCIFNIRNEQIKKKKMKDVKITDAMLFRYFTGQMTSEETDALTAWYSENPEEHQKTMDQAHALYIVSTMSEPLAKDSGMQGLPIRMNWRKAARYISGVAAVLLLGFLGNYYFFSQKLNSWAAQSTVIEAPLGQHLHLTLNDGTSVDLNSGSRLTYPAIFAGKDRRVKLEGEAMFDVTHNAAQPFVVETFVCNVTVLGTRFDVIADETEQLFSTALFQGQVSVFNRLNGERINMAPNTIVDLENGHLRLEKMNNTDNYRWMEGVISLSGLSFEQVMRKLEKAYDVRFSIRRTTYPKIKYKNIKVRVSDGIEHALNVLQKASDFTYEYDETGTTIIIR